MKFPAFFPLAALLLFTAARVSAAIQTSPPLWGFDGRVLGESFNVVSIEIINAGMKPFDGELTLEVDGTTPMLSGGAGLEIGPGTPHQAINLSTASVNFLVTSQPPSHGDRVIDHSDRDRYG